MVLATLEVGLEDEVFDAVQRLCERRKITPDQLVSEHLRLLIASSDDDRAAGPTD